MKTKMQYPLDSKNPTLDGKVHEIVIKDMTKVNINGEIYYVVNYNDITVGNKPMYTFMKKINGILCKVPLVSYDLTKIQTCLNKCPAEKLSESKMKELVPKVIGLAETTSIEDISNNKKIRPRNVTIQYPYNPTSEGIDGNVHQITPTRVVRCSVNGLDLYYMEYFDHNLGHDMITFLIRVNGALYKVPLTSYNFDEIRTFIERYGVSIVDPTSLFAGAGIPTDKPAIGLAMTMSLRDIINTRIDTDSKKPIIDFPLYIPYNLENPMSISNRVFRGGCHIYHDNIEDFVFDKERNGNIIENAIRNGIRANMDRIKNGESFSFDIEVNIPEGTTVALPTKDGRMVLAVYIPGIHRHTVHMNPNMIPQLERPTRLCERLSIRTLDDDYGTFEDDPIVFREGYEGKLPISFLGLPREYTDRTTFYATETPTNSENTRDYFSDVRVAKFRDLFINSMNSIYDLIDGITITNAYAEQYRSGLVGTIREELFALGLSNEDIKVIIRKMDEEFLKQRSGVKKGL